LTPIQSFTWKQLDVHFYIPITEPPHPSAQLTALAPGLLPAAYRSLRCKAKQPKWFENQTITRPPKRVNSNSRLKSRKSKALRSLHPVSSSRISIENVLITIAALVFTTLASAALLDKEVDTGKGTKVCIYSDGSTITIGELRFCPLSK
jgi:hypothetical protein